MRKIDLSSKEMLKRVEQLHTQDLIQLMKVGHFL